MSGLFIFAMVFFFVGSGAMAQDGAVVVDQSEAAFNVLLAVIGVVSALAGFIAWVLMRVTGQTVAVLADSAPAWVAPLLQGGLNTASWLADRTETPKDDAGIIEIGELLGYVPERQGDGSIVWRHKVDVPNAEGAVNLNPTFQNMTVTKHDAKSDKMQVLPAGWSLFVDGASAPNIHEKNGAAEISVDWWQGMVGYAQDIHLQAGLYLIKVRFNIDRLQAVYHENFNIEVSVFDGKLQPKALLSDPIKREAVWVIDVNTAGRYMVAGGVRSQWGEVKGDNKIFFEGMWVESVPVWDGGEMTVI